MSNGYAAFIHFDNDDATFSRRRQKKLRRFLDIVVVDNVVVVVDIDDRSLAERNDVASCQPHQQAFVAAHCSAIESQMWQVFVTADIPNASIEAGGHLDESDRNQQDPFDLR